MAKRFAAEQDGWLIHNHCPAQRVKDLTAAFNFVFSENRSVDTMKNHIRRLGLKQERRNFTKEQDAWLKTNAPRLSVEETASQFNSAFGTSRSAQVLKVRCNRTLKVYHANSKYGLGCPVGTETRHGDYIWVKCSDIPYEKNSFYRNWKPKHRVVWEQHHGELPEGMTVVFLDRNHSNCDISNLYAVDGKTLREMGKKQWWSDSRDLTLAAIKWCEMFYKIKEVE